MCANKIRDVPITLKIDVEKYHRPLVSSIKKIEYKTNEIPNTSTNKDKYLFLSKTSTFNLSEYTNTRPPKKSSQILHWVSRYPLPFCEQIMDKTMSTTVIIKILKEKNLSLNNFDKSKRTIGYKR